MSNTITQYNINIDENVGTKNILEQLSAINLQDQEIEINLKLQYGFIISSTYLILISFINDLRANGKTVNIIFNGENCGTHNYASRINVFQHLNIPFVENFRRHNTSASLIPITKIEKGVHDLSEDILNIFSKNFRMSENDVSEISFMIGEMLCNTSIHSYSEGGAYMYMQRYPSKNTLEFVLVDSGIGIHNSLLKNTKYQGISNAEAVAESIVFEATSGNGRGHGLYFMSEFVKRNNTTLQLTSGDATLIINNGSTTISNNYNWKGVILKIIFKFEANISVTEIMNEKY